MSGPRRYTRPPIAGPAIVETCQALEFTATAREKSAEGTRFGMIAWPAGIENARAMPNTTITPNTGQATVRPDIVNPRSASAQKNSSAMQSARIAARLWRSATWPAGSTSSTNGRNCERPMRPRSSGLPVIAYLPADGDGLHLHRDRREQPRRQKAHEAGMRKQPAEGCACTFEECHAAAVSARPGAAAFGAAVRPRPTAAGRRP